MRRVLALAVILAGCSRPTMPTSSPAGNAGCEGADIAARLACIPGMTVHEETSPGPDIPSGYREFELRYEQPVDHDHPEAGTFQQRLVLLHRGETAPMLLQTSGYAIFSVKLSAVTQYFEMNQVQVEHRDFADSVPASPASLDWSKLDIRQSAADFHRITVALKQVYGGRWLNTGASKGGMTSIFHRRFYPGDLDGTLAYVAPLSFSTADERYVDFVDQVGGDHYAACRDKLETLQKALLQHRDEIVPKLGGHYDQLGSADVAFEHAVLELPFAFWQYQDPTAADVGCDVIPGSDASTDAMASYLGKVNGAQDGYSDEGMAGFLPYYYQAATQLGGPAAKMSHLGSLLRHPETYNLEHYTPKGVPAPYDQAVAMNDIDHWVQTESDGIVFVYGELDPWSAGAYTPRTGVDEYRYFQPGGNHGSNVFDLAADDKKAALARLSHWLGKDEAESAPGRVRYPTLENAEQRYLARHGR